MRGSEFLDKLEAAFPGALKGLYEGLAYGDEGDRRAAERIEPLALALGVTVTKEVIGKARARHGLVAFRQQRRQNGTLTAEHAIAGAKAEADRLLALWGYVDPRQPADQAPAPAEEQLPLAAALAQQLSPDAQAIVGALGQMKGALLSRLTELERRMGLREERA